MISTKFLDNIQVAVHLASGEVDLEQFTNTASNWRKHKDFSPQASVVYDLVTADVSLNWEQAKQELPVCLEQLTNSRDGSSRTAWVVSEDIINVVVDSVHMALPWTTEWRVFKEADEVVAGVISKSNTA
jgi:hypothetical protein